MSGLNVLKWVSIFLPLSAVYAQDLSPTVTIGGSLYPSRNLKDTTGTYGHQRAHMAFSIPLLTKAQVTDNGLKFFLLSFSANANIDNMQLSILPASRTFLAFNSSINGIYRASRKSLWLSKAIGSYFEDQITINKPILRMSGFAMYRRSVSKGFFYLTGGVYSFSYGKGLPLPLLGAGWRFANQASLTVILPISISYRFGKLGSQFTIFVRPDGGVSNFDNNLFIAAPENIFFRRREFALGVKKKITLSKQWSLLAESGILAARKIYFSDTFRNADSSTIFESKVQPSLYLSLAIRYKFKHQQTSDISGEDLDIDGLMLN